MFLAALKFAGADLRMPICKYLCEAIASSARLQLVLEIYASQVVLGPAVTPTPSEQLGALRQFRDGWTAIRPMRKEAIKTERIGACYPMDI